jgi:MFS family permease
LAWSAALLVRASTLAAVASDVPMLVVARLSQGAAGAGIVASSLAAIGHSFRAGAPRAVATSVWGAAVGGGIALGPIVGALLTSSVGWRSSYWLQAVAAALLIPAAASVAESRSERRRRLDLPGAIALTAAMSCVTAGLIEGRTSWLAAEPVVLLSAGVLLLGVFCAIELRRGDPMLEPRLFREPLFIASISGALFTGLAVIGAMSFTPTLLERGMGVSPLGSASVLLAWSATSMVVAITARKLFSRLSAYGALATGLLLCGFGEFGLTGLGAGSSWAQLVPGLAVAGIGSGLANPALGRLAVESVPPDRAGVGSGSNNTARYLGGAAGVALVVALASTGGRAMAPHQLLNGYDLAATVCGVLCLLGAVIAMSCDWGTIARIARVHRSDQERADAGVRPPGARPAEAPARWSDHATRQWLRPRDRRRPGGPTGVGDAIAGAPTPVGRDLLAGAEAPRPHAGDPGERDRPLAHNRTPRWGRGYL